MESEPSKIFGREFIIGFFVPAVFFVVGSAWLLNFLGVDVPWLEINWKKPLEGSAFLGLLALGVAIFLQALNREIFRLAEGYWWSPFRKCVIWYQRNRYRRLSAKLQKLKSENDDAALERTWTKIVTRYPSEESLLLPTAFGNAVRAYEDYPRVIYGFESINGWPRLQALISKEFGEALKRTRAQVDLWLNLGCVTFLFIIEILSFAGQFCGFDILWWLVPLVVLMMLASVRSRSSAIQYGEQVKAAFDVYLPALAKNLGYALSDETEKNKQFWEAFSQVMVYRHPKALERMTKSGLERVSRK